MKERYTEYMHTRMTFGKHKGVYLKDIPDTYIHWAVCNITDRAVTEMFKIEYLRRNPKDRK